MKKCKTSRPEMFDKTFRAVFARQAACLLASLALCCGAAEYTWTGNGAAGNWNDAANWSPSTGAPNAGDTAKLTLSADLTITSDIALSAGTFVISNNGDAQERLRRREVRRPGLRRTPADGSSATAISSCWATATD